MLDGSRMLRRHVRFVRGFSPYATAWQAVLTGGQEEPICQRTNTNLSALYLFLACTIPPDLHETPRLVNRNKYAYTRRPNPKDRMTTATKSRYNTPTASEDDEKLTTEDEKASAGATITEYPRRS